jgi:hypothetical protein
VYDKPSAIRALSGATRYSDAQMYEAFKPANQKAALTIDARRKHFSRAQDKLYAMQRTEIDRVYLHSDVKPEDILRQYRELDVARIVKETAKA